MKGASIVAAFATLMMGVGAVGCGSTKPSTGLDGAAGRDGGTGETLDGAAGAEALDADASDADTSAADALAADASDADASAVDADASDADASAADADANLDADATVDVAAADGVGPRAKQTCLVPTGPTPAAMLSATGCVEPTNARLPAASLVAYDLNSPLWSDGAGKQRFFALPDGATIHVKDCQQSPAACDPKDGGTASDDGHFDFPVGAVLMKTFLVDGKRVETRLLFHVDQDFWRGFSYRWDDAETDATLLPGGADRPLANQTWRYPARDECLTCHIEAAGRSLGPSVAQLNREVSTPTGAENQLARLARLGLLDAPLRAAPVDLPALASPSAGSGATLEARARAYLHANCANCHRPGGPMSGIDLRSGTPLSLTAACEALPMRGGNPGEVLLKPGDHAKSLVSLRMHSLTDRFRMPQLGTSVVDVEGTGLIDSWIDGLVGCLP